ncbi:aldose 1-epimerase [Jiella sonneratiae]|uniref:Aldose 1-epimerase n=1 Tax=Jiella sonneratiae TaxID=2816856 RepID=A0ABS3J0M9_9HYPH|nr:aldose 1-epimerase [Jiella sonneratiae]MBO0903239.1 aldose 1-epimerase [Jiella sonneratiae]
MAAASNPSVLVELAAGDLAVRIAPAVGGAIAGFSRAGVPLLRETPAAALADRRAGLCGSYAMIPYSNRIADASFRFGGEAFRLARNFGDSPHSLHGNGWQRAWEVAAARADFVTLTLDHDPAESPARAAEWPFAYRGEQHFSLGLATLSVTLVVENRDGRPMPAGFGLHPYFDRAGAHLSFAAERVWQSDARLLPTGRSAVPVGWDCRALRPVDDVSAVDHCFEGWGGTAEIVYPERNILISISADPVFSKLVVFRADERSFFAVEPVSHMVDAVNRGDTADNGLKTLAPGERLCGTIRFTVADAPEGPAMAGSTGGNR